MTMNLAGATLVLLSALAFALAVVGVWRASTVWRRYRGMRLVSCPENGVSAAVTIDLRRAIASSLAGSEPECHLATCSRWETRGPGCDEACVPQVSAGGEDSTVRALARRWYAGRPCVLCEQPITEESALDHHAALMDANGRTIEWTDVRPEHLHDVLQSHRPVCWNCHIAKQFRRTSSGSGHRS